nr:tetratricopeptide repeat protein 15 [Hymenolepis microstoma]
MDDPVLSVMELTEAEIQELRKTDAWLPSETTRKCLLEKNISALNSTMPRIIASPATIDITDPLRRELTLRYRSESKADSIRPVITADMVTQDTDGLIDLIRGRWFHAALDMTGRLLTASGHASETGAKLIPFTSQLWLIRFVLLKQTQQYEILENELGTFDRLDNPDVYFEHDPVTYKGRKGSMIPFSLRLLHAELPHYLKRSTEALDRLYFLSAVVSRMITNLTSDYTEDGRDHCPSEAYKTSSLILWRRRQAKILSLCLSIYLTLKDYPSAIDTVYQMIEILKPLGEHRFLYGTLGRIYLEFGDVETAERMFTESLMDAPSDLKSTQVQRLMFNAMLQIGHGRFDEAKRSFREVLQLDPTNVAAANNQAVCLHFTSQMDDSIRILESLTTPFNQQQPLEASGGRNVLPLDTRSPPALHETLISNLAVLHEAESDKSQTKKFRVLERIAGLAGENVALSSFRLPTPKVP